MLYSIPDLSQSSDSFPYRFTSGKYSYTIMLSEGYHAGMEVSQLPLN